MRYIRGARKIRTLGDVQQTMRRTNEYGRGDPNTTPQNPHYSEDTVFNPPALGLENVWQNLNTALLTPFDVANASSQVISGNPRRNGLIIQNQSALGADLYVNFGAAASVANGLLLASGVTLLLDFWCPRDDIHVFFDNAVAQHGVVVEGILATS